MRNTLLKQPTGNSPGWRVLLVMLGMFALSPVLAQVNVSGRITSSDDKSAMPGVNVLVKGTANGVITDADGNFRISVPTGNETLVFSFVGFATQEVGVGGRNTVNVVLEPDVKQLSEVVVTALGVEKDVAKLGYVTQKVSGSELIKAREPNPLNSLVGRVAGLTVGISSELLGRPQLVLRGETNLLIVIDGVPVVSDSWNISPDDIETYTVLKGPNAAALYGSRGQNGAILITTKKGTKDKRGFSVEFNSSTMVDKGFISIPKVQDEYGPGEYNTYKFGDDPFGQINGYNQNDYDWIYSDFEGWRKAAAAVLNWVGDEIRSELGPADVLSRYGNDQYAMLLPNTEARLVDADTGDDVPSGGEGELWIRGPLVMRGYLNNPEATAATKIGRAHV